MTTVERKALRDLRKRTDIKILPADKGNSTVVLSAEDYKNKIEQFLDDPAYVRVDKDPTAKREKQMRKAVEDIYRKGEMYTHLRMA